MGGDADAEEIIAPIFGEDDTLDRFRGFEKGAFIRRWDTFTAEQRRVLVEILESPDEGAEPWFSAPGVPEDLLAEARPWLTRPLAFGGSLGFMDSPRSLALHGIRLPAGFVEWDPMAGSAKRLGLLEKVPSGVLVDMRGVGAPTPAANRLFVLSEESKKSAVPFLRACVRHAVELAAGSPADEGWEPWLSNLMSMLAGGYYWPDLLCAEYHLLESAMKYQVILKDEIQALTPEEMVATFGEWVPVCSHWGKGEGIAPYGPWRTLLVFKERRRRDDGTLEINMVSKVEVPPERVREAIKEMEAELNAFGIW